MGRDDGMTTGGSALAQITLAVATIEHSDDIADVAKSSALLPTRSVITATFSTPRLQLATNSLRRYCGLRATGSRMAIRCSGMTIRSHQKPTWPAARSTGMLETEMPLFWIKRGKGERKIYRIVTRPTGPGTKGLQVPIFGHAGLVGSMSFGGTTIDSSIETRLALSLIATATLQGGLRLSRSVAVASGRLRRR